MSHRFLDSPSTLIGRDFLLKHITFVLDDAFDLWQSEVSLTLIVNWNLGFRWTHPSDRSSLSPELNSQKEPPNKDHEPIIQGSFQNAETSRKSMI